MSNSSSPTTHPLHTQLFMWVHFLVLLILPFVSIPSLLMVGGSKFLNIVVLNIFAFIIYSGSYIRFYRLNKNILVTALSLIPLVIVGVHGIFVESWLLFFVELTVLEVGSFLLGIVMVMGVFRPSGMCGVFLVGGILALFVYSWGGVLYTLHGSSPAVFVPFVLLLVLRAISHGVAVVPAARGGALPEWKYGTVSLLTRADQMIRPFSSEESLQKFSIVFTLGLIGLFVFVPILLVMGGGFFSGLFR